MNKNIGVALFLIFLLCNTLFCQQKKVGLVLSGGGGRGLAHIGVLKALEENNIKIDYIAGTSIGAIIGGFYASGYSIDEIEKLFFSGVVNDWLAGKIDNKTIYTFRQDKNNLWAFSIAVAPEHIIETILPFNIINSSVINYKSLKYFWAPGSLAKNNFDSLFIPFRAVASDPVKNSPSILKKGDLHLAIRASASYPLVFSPVQTKDGSFLIDGGVYNNFPTDIMQDEFSPDIIIGSAVGYKINKHVAKYNFFDFLRTLIINRKIKNIDTSRTIVITSDFTDGVSGLDFTEEKTVEIGYKATKNKIKKINEMVQPSSESYGSFLKKRAVFRSKKPLFQVAKVRVVGVKKREKSYYESLIKLRKGKLYNSDELEKKYAELFSESTVKELYPTMSSVDGYNEAVFEVKKKSPLVVDVGGVLSSSTYNAVSLGLEYKYINKVLFTPFMKADFSAFRKTFSSGLRVDANYITPFYIKGEFKTRELDYYSSNASVFNTFQPKYRIKLETFASAELGMKLFQKTQASFRYALGIRENDYLSGTTILSTDTIGSNRLNYSFYQLKLERNNLDASMYAFEGSSLSISTKYVIGGERNSLKHIQSNSIELLSQGNFRNKSWGQFKLRYEKYFKLQERISLGTLLEAMYSKEPLPINYGAAITTAPSFESIAENYVLFNKEYRAYEYLGIGVMPVIKILNRLQFRLSTYAFLPYRTIEDDRGKAVYSSNFKDQHFLFQTALVYKTFVGPLAINFTYQTFRKQAPFTVLFHFGYYLFKKDGIY